MNESAVVQRRRSPKGEQRRREILVAAGDVFAQGGFDSASLAEIAQKAGITQAGLLHHYPSKNALLFAVLDNREVVEDDSAAGGDADTSATEEAHGVGFLIAFLTALRRHEKDPSETAFFSILSTESVTPTHPAHAYFLNRYKSVPRDMNLELERVFDAAKLPPKTSIFDLSRTLIAIADGMRIQWLFEPDAVVRSELVARHLELLEPYMRDGVRDEFRSALARWRMPADATN
ncbi:TetR/AcrR family transcriptional regulator [Microbacterium sp. R86528]|uniref:TetR/AcrR family transcriptional regulator n=1 Tax=Microbacterium sp. R86528 TaxID=3093864 RepID=UPI0037C980C5